VAREAAALAERCVGEGRLGWAVACAEGGLRAVREVGPAAAAERATLFALWLEAAFEEGAPRAVDPLLHALARAEPWPGAAVIESLAQALKVERFTSAQALDMARAIPTQDD